MNLPRIAVLAHKSMIPMIRKLQPDYADRATILIYEEIFEEALALAERLIVQDRADVVLTGGTNASILREHLRFPLATIKLTGYDLLRALSSAQQYGGPVGLVAYHRVMPELGELSKLFSFDIEQRTYLSRSGAQEAVHELGRHGCKVIVGSSLPVEFAAREGLHSVLLYSEDSIHQGLKEAIELGQMVLLSETRRERLSSIIHNLRDGLLAIDFSGKVQAMNPSFEKSIGLSKSELSRQGLKALPAFKLQAALPGDISELETVIEVGNQTMVMLRSPMHENGKHVGSVFTLQESAVIQQSEQRLLAFKQGNNFSARHSFAAYEKFSVDIAAAVELAKRYAETSSTVLITGESGTGKEWLAQSIHRHSPRHSGPFVPINCAAFPESLLESELFGYEEGAFTGSRKGGRPGLIELAHTGTLFLDEIGDMPTMLQTRLLRVLQEREVQRLGAKNTTRIDIRVIAATHQPLDELIRNVRFRQDLFYRLNVLRIELLPLRVRPNDMSALARHLFNSLADPERHHVPQVRALLQLLLPLFLRHEWPGNIRELNNIVERFAVVMGTLDAAQAPDLGWIFKIAPELRDRQPGNDAVDYAQALEKYGSVAAAAKMLGISRTTLWRRLSKGEQD